MLPVHPLLSKCTNIQKRNISLTGVQNNFTIYITNIFFHRLGLRDHLEKETQEQRTPKPEQKSKVSIFKIHVNQEVKAKWFYLLLQLVASRTFSRLPDGFITN